MNVLVGHCGGRLECLRERVRVEAGQPAGGSNSQRTSFVFGKAEFYPKGCGKSCEGLQL